MRKRGERREKHDFFFVKMVLKRGKCLCNLQVFIFVLKSYAWFAYELIFGCVVILFEKKIAI